MRKRKVETALLRAAWNEQPVKFNLKYWIENPPTVMPMPAAGIRTEPGVCVCGKSDGLRCGTLGYKRKQLAPTLYD